MRRPILLLILSSLFAVCGEVNRSLAQTAQNGPDEEEYEVYSALINERYAPPATQRINILGMSLAAYQKVPEPAWNMPHLHHLTRKMVADFNSNNAEAVAFTDLFRVKVDHELLEKGMAGFTARGTRNLTFSRVGFDERRERALVYVVDFCGGRCGKKYYALLVKKEGVWKVQDVLVTTVM